jgi:hypothetical protein
LVFIECTDRASEDARSLIVGETPNVTVRLHGTTALDKPVFTTTTGALHRGRPTTW